MMSTPSRFRHSSTILAPGTFTSSPYRLRIRRALRGGLAGLEAGLGGAEPRDRNHERRARHVRHADLVTELHRRWLAAVLAADAHLEVGPRPASALDADLDELTDTFLVKDRERIMRQEALLQIVGQELGYIISAV